MRLIINILIFAGALLAAMYTLYALDIINRSLAYSMTFFGNEYRLDAGRQYVASLSREKLRIVDVGPSTSAFATLRAEVSLVARPLFEGTDTCRYVGDVILACKTAPGELNVFYLEAGKTYQLQPGRWQITPLHVDPYKSAPPPFLFVIVLIAGLLAIFVFRLIR